MALTATASAGFENVGFATGEEIFLLPGDPGVTYTKGDTVTPGAIGGSASGADGVLSRCTAGALASTAIGTVMRTTICPSKTTGFPTSSQLNTIENATDDQCLIPVKMWVAKGAPIYEVTFADHKDDTVITYTAATPQVALTTGLSADDYPAGAVVYVYTGTGAGQMNIVDSYDHTGGAAEKMLVFHRAFQTALDSTSKMIILSGEGAVVTGIQFFGGIDMKDSTQLQADDGSNDGDFVLFMDWRQGAALLQNLKLRVVPRQFIRAA
jgi:hypothetical protein